MNHTSIFHSCMGMRGLAFLKSRFGRIYPFSSIRIVFTTAAIPLPPSKCPIFDLTEPTFSGSSEFRPGENTVEREPASIGSPAAVPVPCASTYVVSTGKRDARRLTILVCSGVADHGTYGIARLERFVEALEHETGDALSSAKSIAALIIGITAPIGREESAIVSVPCGG
jgi:hypothetical protein